MKNQIKSLIYGIASIAGLSLVGTSTVNNAIREKTIPQIEYQSPCPFGEPPTQDEYANPKRRYSAEENAEFLKTAYECLPNKPNHITEDFVEQLVRAESNYINTDTSHVGARGLMQVMLPTWEDRTKDLYGKVLPYDLAFVPRINAEVGLRQLVWTGEYAEKNLDNWGDLSDEDKRKIVASAYHAGVGNLKSKNWNVALMGKNNRNYVGKISKAIMDN